MLDPAVLAQRAGLSVRDRDVFVSVAGGASIDEPASDLAVACAIASSVVELSLPADLAVFGKIGLAGEVRAVPGARRGSKRPCGWGSSAR